MYQFSLPIFKKSYNMLQMKIYQQKSHVPIHAEPKTRFFQA